MTCGLRAGEYRTHNQLGNERRKRCDQHRRGSAASWPGRQYPPGVVVVHEGHLIDCGYFQEFLDGAKNRDNEYIRRLIWDAYGDITSGRP
jgi:hypothetical protein